LVVSAGAPALSPVIGTVESFTMVESFIALEFAGAVVTLSGAAVVVTGAAESASTFAGAAASER
jgi:hypothetical protein